MPTIKLKDLVEKKKSNKSSLNESLVASIISLLFGRKLNNIVKQVSSDPELKEKMDQIMKDIEDLKNFVENDKALKSLKNK